MLTEQQRHIPESGKIITDMYTYFAKQIQSFMALNNIGS